MLDPASARSWGLAYFRTTATAITTTFELAAPAVNTGVAPAGSLMVELEVLSANFTPAVTVACHQVSSSSRSRSEAGAQRLGLGATSVNVTCQVPKNPVSDAALHVGLRMQGPPTTAVKKTVFVA